MGADAERIMVKDLGIPSNNDSGQRQCICSSRSNRLPNTCRVCLLTMTLSEASLTSRRPDFVVPTFIVEVKNRQSLLASQRDQLRQITDYANAAKELRRPLWLFTRVDTRIDPQYYQIVEATGGGIVEYLTVTGYVDPVDQQGRTGLGLSTLVMSGIGFVEIRAIRRRLKSNSVTMEQVRIPVNPTPPPTQTPTGSNSADGGDNTLRQAYDAVNTVRKFTDASKEKMRKKIDRDNN